MQCLSSLQSLKDLTLTLVFDDLEVTGEALNSIGSLHQLTHLSLRGWPMGDTDLSYLTHLQLVSLDLDSCLSLTSDCLENICLITSLRSLSLVDGDRAWRDMEEDTWLEIEIMEEIANKLMPFLTTLNVE